MIPQLLKHSRRAPLPLAPLGIGLLFVAVLGIGTTGARRAGAPPPLAPGVASAESTIKQADLRPALEFLASDDLAGRGVGHPGNEAAVRYLASRFEAFRLGQASSEGFLQPVPLTASALGTGNHLNILVDGPGAERRWDLGDDFFPDGGSPSGEAAGLLAYAGFGVIDPAIGVDDFAELDLKGRIVVILQGERTASRRQQDRRTGPTMGALDEPGRIAARVRPAAQRGALAVLVVSRERRLPGFGTTWPSAPSIRQRVFRLEDDRLPIPVVRVGASLGSAILGLDEPRSPARSVAALFDDPELRLGLEGRRLRVTTDITPTPLTTHNVLGVIEGRDIRQRAELVIVGAHLDHDGIGDDGQIYNGADDDGSGTVAVLEIAEAFAVAARSGHVPRRSVLFALWNAEEKGLLGSRYFVNHVAPAGHRAVATLNLDMVGRREDIPSANDPRFKGLRPRSTAEARTALHILGYTFSPDLAKLVKDEGSQVNLSIKTEYDNNPIDLVRRSDHWSFLLAGIPALFFTTGLHPDYHTPRDDVAGIEFDKLERVARLAFRVAWRIAEADESPRFAATARLER